MHFELLRTSLTFPLIDIYAEIMEGKMPNVQITHGSEKCKISKKAKKLYTNTIDKLEEIGLFIGRKNEKVSY